MNIDVLAVITGVVVTTILGLIALTSTSHICFCNLRKRDSVFNTSYIPMLIGCIAGLISVVAGITITIANPFSTQSASVIELPLLTAFSIGHRVVAIVGLLIIAGFVGIVVGIFTQYRKFCEKLFMTMSILFIATIVASITTPFTIEIVAVVSRHIHYKHDDS